MESWFKDVGRPALLEAVAGVCDRIDNKIGESVKSHVDENKRLSAELESLRSRVSDVDRLEEENRRLKKEVQSLRDLKRADASSTGKSKSHNDARDFRSPLAPKSVNQVSNPRHLAKSGDLNIDELSVSELKDGYRDLDRIYTKLYARFSELQDAHVQLDQRLRDKTQAYTRWVDHATQLNELCQKRSRIIKKLEAKLEATTAAGTGPLGTNFSSDTPDRSTSRSMSRSRAGSNSSKEIRSRFDLISTDSPLPCPPGDAYSAGRISPGVSLQQTVNRESRAGQRDSILELESRISTEDEDTPQLPPFPQDQNIPSKVVSVKDEPSSDAPVVVSERCVRKRRPDDDLEQTGRAPTKVKTESGSDPLVTGEQHHFTAHESIDFDAGGNRVDTPRKRNRTNRELVNMIAQSPAASFSQPNFDISTGLDGAFTMSPPLRENHGTTSIGNGTAVQSADLREDRSTAFQPSNCNAQLRKRAGESYSTKRKDFTSLQAGIASLAEDGDENETPKTTTGKKSKVDRLRSLLNTPSPGLESITPPPGIPPSHVRTPGSSEFLPPRRELPFGKGGAEKTDKRAHTPVGSEISTNQRVSTAPSEKRASDARVSIGISRTSTPLRERPKCELSLKDFKISPNANDGYDYAFTDVVRNKDERASLAGCVDETCCGQTFRLQASAKRDQTSPIEFQALLENYLGDDAWKLSSMTKQEKEDLWLKAKTQELANEHGKHRHRFHRAASPVGYWRTDFPSTQEDQREREEAAKAMRRMIEDRYREAMRPGGRWLFRDE
ncbi:SAE2-domain-containing protein [Hypomontagnella monticulosa]|nr:SAE2-domain-containing protein [Hypomontagnella monticulosa]